MTLNLHRSLKIVKEMFCRAKKLPPFDLIKELLNYNIITGVFTWKVKKSNKKAGSIAGRVTNKGYVYITIDGKGYAAHRLAWLLVTTKDPYPYEVDHKDGDKGNNAFHNLRQATPQQNSSNRKIGSNNTSGHKSIAFMPNQTLNPYYVCISQQNKSYSLGSFPTLEKAIKARDKKGKEIYGEFYRP